MLWPHAVHDRTQRKAAAEIVRLELKLDVHRFIAFGLFNLSADLHRANLESDQLGRFLGWHT